MLGLPQSQQTAAPHAKKRGGGLLSRLFGSQPGAARNESSSATSRPCTGGTRNVQCAAAPPQYGFASSTASAGGTSGGASMSTAGEEYCRGTPFLGFKANMEDKYSLARELGSGGNGVVRVVVNRETGEEFACKSIKKVLKEASEKKKQGHLESIRREVTVLTKLRGSLNVVKLEDVYEDEEHVHIVMEMCSGGELWHRIGDRHYSERTVASFMRAVLRTLAQCHAQNILHRDIKPGNFMLLSGDDRAPVKAIDFGLAAPYNPEQLPRTDLGLEGTPWYMAPETLRGEWSPASDVWAAGVMAFQLLSGRFPFDDKKNSFAPAITAIWRSVLNDSLDFKQSAWAGVSEEAKDFCRLLLAREVAGRPSAREALKHPWLRGDSSERSVGKQLSRTVVARIQRFAAGGLLKRTVLQSIAEELLAHPELITTAANATTTETNATAVGGSGESQVENGVAATGEAATAAAAEPAAATISTTQPAPPQQQHVEAAAGLVGPLLSSLSALRLDRPDAALDERQLGEALGRMGFRLAPSEVTRLMEGMVPGVRAASSAAGAGSGADLGGQVGDQVAMVGRAALAASLMDWRHLQRNHSELWLQLASSAFRNLDSDGSGVLEVDELIAALRARLPPEDVATAVEEALQHAAAANGGGGGLGLGGGLDSAMTTGGSLTATGFGAVGGGGIGCLGVGMGLGGMGLAAHQGIDFEAFVKLLRVGSHDSLDMYDDRMSVRSGGSRETSLDRYNALLAASSHPRRTGVLATSCSTITTTDWSRHGPGGSRHGSRHGGLGLAGDASVHSNISDRSDVTAVQDNDRSQHGVQLQQQQFNRPVASNAIAFRFDTACTAGRTDRYGKGGAAAAAPLPSTAAAGNVGAAGMVWRFDVGGPKALPPPPAQPMWRFDVVGGGKDSWSQTAASDRGRVAVVAAAAAGQIGAGGVDRSGSGGGGGRHCGGGGYFDRRMHGSNLYRNAALKALQGGMSACGGGGGGVGSHHHRCLDTVAE